MSDEWLWGFSCGVLAMGVYVTLLRWLLAALDFWIARLRRKATHG